MTAEKKDRKPLRIKNLADLKRHIKLGTELVATAHQYHPDIIGLTRVVTKVQTNGFYSKIKHGDTETAELPDQLFWAGVYKAICAIRNAPEDKVREARTWLASHGFSDTIRL